MIRIFLVMVMLASVVQTQRSEASILGLKNSEKESPILITARLDWDNTKDAIIRVRTEVPADCNEIHLSRYKKHPNKIDLKTSRLSNDEHLLALGIWVPKSCNWASGKKVLDYHVKVSELLSAQLLRFFSEGKLHIGLCFHESQGSVLEPPLYCPSFNAKQLSGSESLVYTWFDRKYVTRPRSHTREGIASQLFFDAVFNPREGYFSGAQAQELLKEKSKAH